MIPKPNSTTLTKVKLDDDGWIQAEILGQRYLEWVEVTSGKMALSRCSTAGLTTQLRLMDVEAKSHRFSLNNGKHTKAYRCFQINEATLLEKFRKRLQDPQFEFDKLEQVKEEDEDEEKKVVKKKDDKVGLDKIVKNKKEESKYNSDSDSDSDSDSESEDEEEKPKINKLTKAPPGLGGGNSKQCLDFTHNNSDSEDDVQVNGTKIKISGSKKK